MLIENIVYNIRAFCHCPNHHKYCHFRNRAEPLLTHLVIVNTECLHITHYIPRELSLLLARRLGTAF